MNITEPGVYDIPSEQYHADEAVSSGTLRAMLPPSCPQLARYKQTHPVHKDAFDLGHVAHRLVLGKGEDFDIIHFDGWTTKAAREQRDKTRDAGRVPLLARDAVRAVAMADAVLTHPVAGRLFEPGTGVPERSIFWRDEQTGLMCRAMFDWLGDIPVDLKTTHSASLTGIPKSMAEYGYHQQRAWYEDGRAAIGLPPAPFPFVFVEVNPPHIVTIVDFHDEAVQVGRDRNRRALELYAQCLAADDWPPYSDEIETISLPKWAQA